MYVLVGGVPGSGKTTLARQLAPLLGVPLIAKDAIKEALMAALGPPRDVAESQRWGRASVLAMLTVAQSRSGSSSRQHVVPVRSRTSRGSRGRSSRCAVWCRWTSPSGGIAPGRRPARRAPRRPADRGGAVGRRRASAATPRTPRGSRHNRRGRRHRNRRGDTGCCEQQSLEQLQRQRLEGDGEPRSESRAIRDRPSMNSCGSGASGPRPSR